MKRKAVTMSLQFLMGLIFTAFLILAAWRAYIGLFYGVGEDKTLIDNWVDDIESMNKDTTTQLLPPGKIGNNYYFAFFGATGQEVTVSFDGEDYTLRKQNENNPAICSFSLGTKKTSYCRSFKSSMGVYVSGSTEGGDTAVAYLTPDAVDNGGYADPMITEDILYISKTVQGIIICENDQCTGEDRN